jgi:hypothetical protein
MSEPKSKTGPNKPVLIGVTGDNNLEAPAALFSNLLGLARVGTEIQFEFIFLDLNQMANIIQTHQGTGQESANPVQGQTVAKIVMPAAAFVQLKERMNQMFADVESNTALPEELKNVAERRPTTGS